MTDLDAAVGEPPPPYMIFVVVFLFFVTGLLGFLVCHLLKKKGYRCRTAGGDDEEDLDEKKQGLNTVDDEEEDNQDTVEQILKCIIENEANMEAFKEMLGTQNVCVRHDPRLRKESLGGIPPHMHTVHSGSDHTSCLLCAQSRNKKGRRRSRTPRYRQKPGEQTILSVGRFRVTHTDKKLHGGGGADSGEQLDQSQDSEDRREGQGDGYNLRNMFKDVRPPPDPGTNGTAPAANPGKRRRSLSNIFGLRRGSDPSSGMVKSATLPGGGAGGGGGGGGGTGGLQLFQQQSPPPVVLEEPVQTSSPAIDAGVRTESRFKTTVGQESGAAASFALTPEASPARGPVVTSADVPGPGPGGPVSLPLLASPGRTVDMATPVAEKDAGGGAKRPEVYSPGPLQTSTPISPGGPGGPGSGPGFTSSHGSPRPETSRTVASDSPSAPGAAADRGSSAVSSPDPGFGGSLASLSLGSSPPSSLLDNTSLQVLAGKAPPSPPLHTPSPKLPHTPTPSEALKPASPSPSLTPSLKLPQTPSEALKPAPLSPSLSVSPKLAQTPTRTPSEALKPAPLSPSLSPIPAFNPKTPGQPPASLSPLGRSSSPLRDRGLSPSPKLRSALKSRPSPVMTSSPALSPDPNLTQSPAETRSPFLSPDPNLSQSPAELRSPFQTPSPVMTRSPALSPDPNLSQSPAETRSPFLSPDPNLSQSPASPRSPFQTPSLGGSPRLQVKSDSVFSVASPDSARGGPVPTPTTPPSERRGEETDGLGRRQPDEAAPAPSAVSFTSDVLSVAVDKLSSLPPVSPPGPLSPSSPLGGGRVSSVTVVKASPDSKRVFSVVTMVEEEGEAARETPPQEDGGAREEEKEGSMMQMEDFGDCKVRREEEEKA